MKRSEMIKDIATEIILFDNTIPLYQAELFACILLNRIEKLGMLPPYLSKDRQYPDSLNQHSWEEEKDET